MNSIGYCFGSLILLELREGTVKMLNLKACPQSQFLNDIGTKEVVCFGAGCHFEAFIQKNRSIKNRIKCVIDNNLELDGMQKEGLPIYSIKSFIEQGIRDIAILITSFHYSLDIIEQLDNIDFFNGFDCYVIEWNLPRKGDFCLLGGEQKIPKIIHYCWFGEKEMPEYLQCYVNTWKKYCSDYEIIKWDENNYDISKNGYMFQAYKAGKLGFVPDYARIDIIREYGGIYLDTDVELIRNLDHLLSYDFYCGFESEEYINLGSGFGAVKGHPLLYKMLESYQGLDYIENGKGNAIPSPYYQSEVIKREGFFLNGMYQEKDGIGIFPCDVLAPGGILTLPGGITENTVSIHHYDASWVSGRDEMKSRQEKLKMLYAERILKR